MKVTVKFGADSILIPVQEGATVGWLKDQFATRLQKKTKSADLQVVNEITLEDGTSLDFDDPLADLVSDNAVLLAVGPAPAAAAAPAVATSAGGAPPVVVAATAFFDEATKRENEPIVQCVQCGREFRESVNPDGGCLFHSGAVSGRGDKMMCCDKGIRGYRGDKPGWAEHIAQGCVRGKHVAAHHRNYPYHQFFKYVNLEIVQKMTNWIEVEREDSDDHETGWKKVLYVGAVGNKLGVVMKTAIFVKFGALMTADEVVAACAEGKDGVVFALGDDNWHIRCRILADGGRPVAIEGSVKCWSDPTPETFVVPINICDGKVNKAGDANKTSSADVVIDFSKEQPLPAFQCSGPTIDPIYTQERDLKPVVFEESSTSDAGFSLALMEGDRNREPYGYQCSERDGAFENNITVPLRVIRTSEENVIIEGITAEFRIGGEWKPASSAHIGVEGFRGPVYDEVLPFTLTKKDVAGIIYASFSYKVTGTHETGESRWIHSSLGNPCHFRFAIRTAAGKVRPFEMHLFNKPLKTATPQDNTLALITCDDVSTLTRVPIHFTLGSDTANWWLELSTNEGCRNCYNDSLMNGWASKAKAAGSSEFLIEDKSTKEDANPFYQIFALVNITDIKPWVYGFKVHIRTKTSSVTESFQFFKGDKAKTRFASKLQA